MIRIKKEEVMRKSQLHKEYHVYIDNVCCPQDDASAYPSSGGKYSVTISDRVLCEKVITMAFADIPNYISGLILYIGYEYQDFYNSHVAVEKRDDKNLYIAFELGFKLNSWRRPWSMGEFGSEFERIMKEEPYEHVTFKLADEDVLGGLVFQFPVSEPSITLETEMQKRADEVEELIETIHTALSAKVPPDAIVSHFSFPEEIRVACEQYLLYFIQFLKDLGVEANAELQNESGSVLFTVTPKGDKEALEKIRQALEIYLQLPYKPGLQTVTVMGAEIEVQRLMANIQHLNGQLMLAQAIIQAKDATIEAKEATILQLKNPDLFVPTTPGQDEPKEKEDLLGGAVSIKLYEGRGFEINLPMMFRRLKDWFAED